MTGSERISTLAALFNRTGETARETNLPAEPSETEADPRIPRSDEDQGWPESSQTPPGKGAQASRGLAVSGYQGDREPTGFPRSERLRRSREFRAVLQRGSRVEQSLLIVLWRDWDGPRQVGFAVSRRIRGAVRRNRARRRLREAYRASRQSLPSGVQIVCVAREAVANGTFQALRQEMTKAFAVVARRLRATAGS